MSPDLDFGSTAARRLKLGGATLLHVAAEYGNVGATKPLLDRGADVNARAALDRYAVASQAGEVTIYRQLWKKGRLVRTPVVALKVLFAFFYSGGNGYDFSRDLSTIVYARPNDRVDLYFLEQRWTSGRLLQTANGGAVSEFSHLKIVCPSVRPIEHGMREPQIDPKSTVFPAQPCRL